MSKTTVLYDKIWYLPTFLVAKDGSVTLLVHHYQIRRGKNINLHNKIDALEFSNESEMAETIQRKRYRALPSVADGMPQFVPSRVQALVAKHKAEL